MWNRFKTTTCKASGPEMSSHTSDSSTDDGQRGGSFFGKGGHSKERNWGTNYQQEEFQGPSSRLCRKK